jgi:oxygen-independent coproporphyrinogen-3 oxidase
VSLGLQSTRARGLQMLGRVHDGPAGIAATEAAIAAGLRVGVDLIVGWPGQRRRELLADVDAVAAAGVEHVSVYALTIEPDTPWEALERRGTRTRPDPDRQADLLGAIEPHLVGHGFLHYEVAGYARSPAALALHNLGYWAWRDVLALGPSAASVRHAPDGSLERRTNRRGLARWAAAPDDADIERLDPVAAAAEGLWLGLRRLDGIALPAFLARFVAVDEAWVRQRVARQVTLGNLIWAGPQLRVAPGRWLWHDAVGIDLV